MSRFPKPVIFVVTDDDDSRHLKTTQTNYFTPCTCVWGNEVYAYHTNWCNTLQIPKYEGHTKITTMVILNSNLVCDYCGNLGYLYFGICSVYDTVGG